MLVLTLVKEDRLYIGDTIVLLVNDVKENKVRLGVDAPKAYRIVKCEREKKAQETPPAN